MKNYIQKFAVCLLMTASVLTSCSSDDDGGNTDEDLGNIDSINETYSIEELASEDDNTILYQFEVDSQSLYEISTNEALVGLTLTNEDDDTVTTLTSGQITPGNYTVAITTASPSTIDEFSTFSLTIVELVAVGNDTDFGTITGNFSTVFSYETSSSATGNFLASFTITEAADYEFETSNTSYDPFLTLWQVDGEVITNIDQNDDIVLGVNLDSRITGSLEAGTYILEISGFQGDTGTGLIDFDLDF